MTKKTKSKPKNTRPRWTKEEISRLRALYKTHSNAEIAKELGRKVASIVFKGHRLGLSKSATRLKEMGKQNIQKRWGTKKGKGSKAA